MVAPNITSVAISIIDLFTALKPHPEYFPDGIHPNADGAELMAQTVHAALLKTPVQPNAERGLRSPGGSSTAT